MLIDAQPSTLLAIDLQPTMLPAIADVFEWLGEAGKPLFGAVNKEFLKA
jgi:hypothetical protein